MLYFYITSNSFLLLLKHRRIPLRKKEYRCWVEFFPTNRITSTNHDLIELADLFLVRGMKGSVELVLSQA
ncbi:hypothetical protein ANTPLA_LOCUS592 [Anthophora plagiata]